MAQLLWLADDVVVNLDTVVTFQIYEDHIQVITLNPKIEYKVDGEEMAALRTFLAENADQYWAIARISRPVTGETTKSEVSDQDMPV